jgi:hypothetical protein
MVPHFPQICELRRRPRACHHRRKTRLRSEIQIVFVLAIPDVQANFTFHSPRIVTHGEFETAVYRPTLTARATPTGDSRITMSDAGSSNALSQDVQRVWSYALGSPDKSGKFGAEESVTLRVAVNAGLQPISFPQSFQQAPPCPQTVQSALSPSFAGCLSFVK